MFTQPEGFVSVFNGNVVFHYWTCVYIIYVLEGHISHNRCMRKSDDNEKVQGTLWGREHCPVNYLQFPHTGWAGHGRYMANCEYLVETNYL